MKTYGLDGRWAGLAADFPQWEPARICSQYGELYRAAAEDGELLCQVSGRLLHDAGEGGELPAVGDFVLISREGERGAIHRLLPRRSAFTRRAAGDGHRVQVVAANIDTVFICMSMNENYSLSRLERALAIAWSSGAEPVAVLTKADIAPDATRLIRAAEDSAPGVAVIAVAENDAASRERLRPWLLPGKTVSFIGSSGVGKSTLINRLAGGELLATGEIRADGRGRHTTTRRELLILPGGAIVIDTPGMRELGADSADISRAFADVDALAERCRFRDCGHSGEPGCAVLAALERGELSQRRLDSWRKLKKEARYEGLNFRELEAEKLSGMFRDVGGMKNMRKFIRQNDKRRGG